MHAGVWACGLNQELNSSSVLVAELLGKVDGIFVKLLTKGLVDVWSWSNLHYFLVTALNRAIALEKVDHIAGTVSQNLNLDVSWSKHRLLKENSWVTKGTLSFSGGLIDRVC
jgi:hypothetical protein